MVEEALAYEWWDIAGTKYYWNTSKTSRNLAVFVHGLDCQNVDVYWGNFPQILCAQMSNPSDFLFWKYDTNLGAFDRLRALKERRPKLANAKALGLALHSFLLQSDRHLERNSYEKIALVGHSQGGLVSINSAFKNLTDARKLPIIGLCAASTPTFRSKLALAHKIITLGSNPQTRYLGQKKDFKEEITIKLPLITQNMHTEYITAIGDEALENEQLVHLFRQERYIQGEHAWPSQVNKTSSPGYIEIESFLNKVFT